MKQIEAKYLWHTDWYDGPLEGACEYNGRIHWFIISDFERCYENGKEYTRDKYKVYYISDEEIKLQTYWHNLCEKIDDTISYYELRKYFYYMYNLNCSSPSIDDTINLIGYAYF